MPETLLQTKLHIPPLRPNLVSRPRLVEQLNQGLRLGGKLALVSAPAGFGKTTLIREWIGRLAEEATTQSQTRGKIAWLSLDEGDNDPLRFLSYFVAALNQSVENGTRIGKEALAMVHSAEPSLLEPILISLINDISAISYSRIIILDDYHLVDSPQVDEVLAFLVDHLPSQFHLVIATRSDPNLPFARYRARGQLTELRAAELRFTSIEAAELLNNVIGLNISAENIAILETRTEGWIAGLQLASIALQGPISDQGRIDSTKLIKNFTGSHRFVLDYLIEEVLNHQSEAVKIFLLKTAVLDRMTGSLCDALTGRNDGQHTLHYLDQTNLFIVPLDEERHWYRYHHLFYDLLCQRLRQVQPDWVKPLHQKASEWYEQNEMVDGAIDHSLQADDFARAGYLIENYIDLLWGQGEHRKIQRWLDRLPEHLLFSRPKASIFQARYQCSSGQLVAAGRTLDVVERTLKADHDDIPGVRGQRQIWLTESDRIGLLGRASATRALMCSYLGDVPGILQHAHQALEYLPNEDVVWRSVTSIILGNTHGFKGDMTAAYEARYQALKACEAAGDIYYIILANLELAITLREQGKLRRTVEICQQQLQAARESGLARSRVVGWLLGVWGETLAELNDLDGALNRAMKGFELTRFSGDLQMIGWSFMCLMRILLSRRDLADAVETIHTIENIAPRAELPPWIASEIKVWQARLWLAQDDTESASQWLEERAPEIIIKSLTSDKIDFFLLNDHIVVARILVALGRLEEAHRLQQHLLKAAETGGRTSKVIEIKILQSLALQAMDEPGRALSILEGALLLAEPHGFVRVFLDEGQPIARLLHLALNQGIAPKYVHRLLAAFPPDMPEQAIPSIQTTILTSQSTLVEPISERELEVLQLIALGLTNREIADRLYLSLNTVKVHTRNIYGKLNVHSRSQAIAISHELGILRPKTT